MYAIIKNIESLAIERGQDTLFIGFPEIYKLDNLKLLEGNEARVDFLHFMNTELPHLKLEFSTRSYAVTKETPYFGDIAIHVETDMKNTDYKKILDKYENGDLADRTAVLYITSLDQAKESKIQEERMLKEENFEVDHANLGTGKTGILSGFIYISTIEGNYGPRIKYKGNLRFGNTWFSVSISNSPEVIEGNPNITRDENLKKIFEFVKLNYRALNNFWVNGIYMPDKEVRLMIKSLKKPINK